MTTPQVLIVGGGMITHDQILPSLYQLQRQGASARSRCAPRDGRRVQALAEAAAISRARFPGRRFRAYPESGDRARSRNCSASHRAHAAAQIVVVAVPDQLHYDVIMTALRHDQHVCAVKPLVLRHQQAVEIEREALRARPGGRHRVSQAFRRPQPDGAPQISRGLFGEFRLGTACLLEKWYYRHSNFQNWMTTENSDAFTYIGCHYVDLVHFITGLLPAAVSVYGIRDKYPNGNEGYLWTDARVIWNNGACLNVQNALGFPDAAPGTNTQGMTLYCSGRARTARCCAFRPVSRPGIRLRRASRTARVDHLCRAEPGLFPVRRSGRRRADAGRATAIARSSTLFRCCVRVEARRRIGSSSDSRRSTPPGSWRRRPTAATTSR